MNEYDSNRIADLLQSIDLKRVDDEQLADYFIFNTCHIREKATQKVYSDIGKIKKIFRHKRSKPTFILAGCVAQAESSVVFEKSDFVDIVVGPQAYHKLPGIIQEHDQNREKICNTDLDVSEKFDTLNSYKNNFSKVSSFVTIQEGCDKFCKFCVVPYTRGPEFSRSADTIIKEVQNLVDYGTREVVLLGQNVSAYQHEDFNLAKLIKQIATIAKLERIRFTTSHPNDFDEELINIFKYEPKLMPQLHLPVQSGSNKILELMNRKHTREFYLDLISKFKSARSDIEFSSDFIVGYPGETEEDFEILKNWVKSMRFERLGCFTYSHEENTHAYHLKDDVPLEIKQKRSNEIMEIQAQISWEHNQSLIGQVYRCLIDRKEGNHYIGRTFMDSPDVDNEVLIDAAQFYLKLGDFTEVKITAATDFDLIGIPLNQ